MPVQIPQVDRFQPQQEEPSAGRIETQVPNGEKDIAGTSSIIEKGIGTANDLFDKAENDAATFASISAANDYEIWKRGRAAEAKKYEGDPTHLYRQIESDSSEKQNEILSQYKDYSPKAQAMIQMRLRRVDARLSNKMATDESIAYSTWQNKETDANVALASQGVIDSVMNVKANDPKSFVALRSQLNAIEDPIIALGDQRGLITEDEFGNQKYSKILDNQILKAKSAALKSAVVTLNNAGHTDEAKYILDNFSDDITPHDMASMSNDHKEALINKKAASIAQSLRFSDEQDANDRLDNMNLDPQVWLKAKEYIGSNARRMEAADKRADNGRFEDLSQKISSNPDRWSNFNDFKNDPENKDAFNAMSSKNQQHIKKLFDPPTTSDSQAFDTAYSKMINGDLLGMSAPDLNKLVSHLDRGDRNRVTKQWQMQNDPSNGQVRSQITGMGQQLQREMISAGLVKTYLGAGGKLPDKQMKIYQLAYNTMIDAVNSGAIPKTASPDVQQKWVRDHVQELAKGVHFWNAGEAAPKLESSPTATPAPSSTPSAPAKLTPDMIDEWTPKFMKENKRKPNGMAELVSYIKSHGGQ